MTEEIENCNFQQNYNVFGLDDKPCCYLYHKYCDEIDSCYFKKCIRLEQENKELKKQHYETLKMLKHEYDGRQRDNEQWFTRCTENHNEDSKIIEKYRSALEEIREINNKWLKHWMNDSDEVAGFEEIENKIDEVLNDI